MKPNNTLTGVREGDLGGEKIQMGFDPNSINHIMSILTDLYEDPELAVIREYSTNARDAHIEAGNADPIEIYKPNSMSPFFRVVDRGIGLNVDGIREVYSQYGASTKRGTNSQTGMLGVGCKSALTYSNQFTVVGVLGGVKTIVAISRNEEGGGVMEVVDTLATDEPNGVEVSIPAKSGHFTTKVDNFFQWWADGTVIIDGEPPRKPKMDQIADNIYVMDSNLVGAPRSDIVIMGNVPYAVGSRLTGTTYRSGNFWVIAYVDMGAVNFTPSREALHYTKKTEAEIARIAGEFQNGVQKWGAEQIAKAKDRFEAFEIRDTCKNRFGDNFKYTYKGDPIPNAIYLNMGITTFNPHTTSKYNTGGSVNLSGFRPSRFLYITDLPANQDINTTLRTKARHYAKNLGDIHLVVFVHPGFTCNAWAQDYIDGGHSLTLAELQDYKPPRNPNAVLKPKTDPIYDTYDVAARSHRAMKLSELKSSLTGGKVAYVSNTDMIEAGQWYRRPEGYQVSQRILDYATRADAQYVVVLGRNRWDKLRRDLPGIKHLKVMLAEKITFLETTLTDADKLRMSIQSEASEVIMKFKNAKGLDDPEFAKLVEDLSQSNSKYYLNRGEYIAAINRTGVDYSVDKDSYRPVYFDSSKYALDARKVVARYPLMNFISSGAPLAEKIFYVNARYATIKDGK